jgi:hypothetical protein
MRELAQDFAPLRKFFILGEKIVYGKYKPASEPDWIAAKGTRDS